MITEDYVSYETAKLLKEKGFDVNAINSWHIVPSQTCNFEDLEKVVCGDINEPEYSEDYYPMITLQMAMKWLREVHYYSIEIDTLGMMELNTLSWRSAVYYLVNENECYCEDGFNSYEEACEAAIKYCLKNLV